MSRIKIFSTLCLVLLAFAQVSGKGVKRIVVDAAGKGAFRTIQEAINSLPDSSAQPAVIFIRKGTYREKVFVEKSNIIFEGEDREKTIITAAINRDGWRCSHPDDWGVATLNINGNDITLKNLTIVNSYGFDWKADSVITCPLDTAHPTKTIGRYNHQMALRTMLGTRLKAINCHFRSLAGDTVSPWNVGNGLFYFSDCTMEGGVDFYCPRGWAYAEGCTFIAHGGDAAIWHDGSAVEDSKTVLKNCTFKGYDGFKLGRYHRDAQFYLIGCRFDQNMADQPIYRVKTTNLIQWGERIYYWNCHKKGGDFSWFADNLKNAPGSPDPAQINARWTFGDKWNFDMQ